MVQRARRHRPRSQGRRQAHLWFVTIHPFDDGNGRIARAIADMALARSEGSPQRFYSMSAQIREERYAYYDILEQTQKGPRHHSLDGMVSRLPRPRHRRRPNHPRARFSTKRASGNRSPASRSTTPAPRPEPPARRLRRQTHHVEIRQLAKCSPDTALRDILPLVDRGALVRGTERGRSTAYALPVVSPG